MNAVLKLREYLLDHRITKNYKGYEPLMLTVMLIACGNPCGVDLLKKVGEVRHLTAKQLSRQIKTIQNKFLLHAPEEEREMLQGRTVYVFLTFLALFFLEAIKTDLGISELEEPLSAPAPTEDFVQQT